MTFSDDQERYLAALFEILFEITADLVTEKANRNFLKALFRESSGTWSAVITLPVEAKIREALENWKVTDLLNVVWLDYPQSSFGSGYCVIFFYMDQPQWKNAMIYNKAWFEKTFI